MTTRKEVEIEIIRRLVQDSMDAGYRIGVDDGGGEKNPALAPTTRVDEVMAALFSVDEDRLFYVDEEGKRAGWVLLVHGNCGWDVIADYTVSLEHIMGGATEISNRHSSEVC